MAWARVAVVMMAHKSRRNRGLDNFSPSIEGGIGEAWTGKEGRGFGRFGEFQVASKMREEEPPGPMGILAGRRHLGQWPS